MFALPLTVRDVGTGSLERELEELINNAQLVGPGAGDAAEVSS
jgi:hypothetical protein